MSPISIFLVQLVLVLDPGPAFLASTVRSSADFTHNPPRWVSPLLGSVHDIGLVAGRVLFLLFSLEVLFLLAPVRDANRQRAAVIVFGDACDTDMSQIVCPALA